MIVVADTTPLISLMNAARLDILEPLFKIFADAGSGCPEYIPDM